MKCSSDGIASVVVSLCYLNEYFTEIGHNAVDLLFDGVYAPSNIID
jgi:hypothetical protein